MVDETKTEDTINAAIDAAQAPAKAVADQVEAVVAKTARKTATTAKTATKTTARAKKVAKTNSAKAVVAKAGVAKTVRAKNVRGKNAETIAKKTTRAATSARRTAQAAVTGAATQIERTSKMTNDFTQMFAGFQLPGADKFQGMFADAGARSQDMVAKSRNASEEMTDLAKANVEALAEAGRIAAAGVKSIGQDVVASSRTGFEHASEAVKTLADAKSPTEFFQLQSELVRSSFDRMVAESSKLTEQMVKLAGEAIQPISNRASVNAERVNELMA